MFEKLQNLYKLQKQAKTMQNELQKMTFTAQTSDNMIMVVVNGAMEIVELTIQEGAFTHYSEKSLSKAVKETIDKAMTKAKKASSENMKKMMGEMGGLPGLT
ncbi:MAG: YbaB/EbfC family nucleoid-associated protein [Candidatus Abawacabacteria bacterium]|nr:YbaB/EbfC family nucleoid-associated protein [Candidatus Abawacabacteria bacterium]